jgi:hypothetical protein
MFLRRRVSTDDAATIIVIVVGYYIQLCILAGVLLLPLHHNNWVGWPNHIPPNPVAPAS